MMPILEERRPHYLVGKVQTNTTTTSIPEPATRNIRAVSIDYILILICSGELHPVVIDQPIPRCAGVAADVKLVPVRLAVDDERIVDGVERLTADRLKVDPQSVRTRSSAVGQQVQTVVAQPEVAARVAESSLVARPRLVEVRRRQIRPLLNQDGGRRCAGKHGIKCADFYKCFPIIVNSIA